MDAGDGRGGMDAGDGRGPAGVIPYGLLPPLRAGGRGVGCGCWGCWGCCGCGFGRCCPSPPWRRCCCCCCCCWRAARAAASCSAFNAAALASAAATSMSWALAGLAALGGGPGTGRFGGPGLAAGRAGAAALLSVWVALLAAVSAAALAALAISSRSRRATGASTVLDADFTNSPMSFNLASTVLLGTPSSFASSCTRALPATALLNPRPRGQTRGDLTRPLEARSSQRLHRVLMSVVLSSALSLVGRTARIEQFGQRSGVGDAGEPQRPPEGAAPLCQLEACWVGMQVRPPPRQSAARVRNEPDGTTGPVPFVHDGHDPQQLRCWRTFPAAHTCAHPTSPLRRSHHHALCHAPV